MNLLIPKTIQALAQKIQDFAQELSAVYEKFYSSFLQTLDQHGMYLVLIK